MKLDIIGDVHGRCEELKRLLGILGYSPVNGVWRHPERKALFMGDLVDRGPDVAGVLELVKGMANAGEAKVILGNHELGLLCWYMPDGKGSYLRPHKERYLKYMGPSVAYFDAHPEAREVYFPWFQSLPIRLECGGARFIHAYWAPGLLALLGEANSLNECGWGAPRFRKTKLGKAVEKLVKGPELNLAGDMTIQDKYGESHNSTRLKWWARHPQSLGDLLLVNAPELAAQPIDDRMRSKYETLQPNPPPTFIAHYGFVECPGLLAPNLACVDFQGKRRDWIGAYRWNGESELKVENFVREENAK